MMHYIGVRNCQRMNLINKKGVVPKEEALGTWEEHVHSAQSCVLRVFSCLTTI